MTTNCLQCNLATNNPKFCNRSCSAIYNNSRFPKRKPEHNCKVCNCPINAKRRYCSNCKYTINWDTVTLSQVRGRRRYQKHSVIRDRARRLYLSQNTNECKRCGYDKHIEVCHIKSIRDFPGHTKISSINHPNNLIGLCPNCHWELDANIWSF